jgi:hypothetical protein
MLSIRPEQMRVFDEEAKQTFIGDIARELREQYPEEVEGVTSGDLRRLVAEGLERASRYGFRKKYSLSMFVQLLFLAAPDFDRYPPIRYILSHPGLAPDDRVDHVIQTMRDSDWTEIRRRAGRPPH